MKKLFVIFFKGFITITVLPLAYIFLFCIGLLLLPLSILIKLKIIQIENILIKKIVKWNNIFIQMTSAILFIYSYLGLYHYKKGYKENKSRYRNLFRIRRLFKNNKIRIGETYRDLYVSEDFKTEYTFKEYLKLNKQILIEYRKCIENFNSEFNSIKYIMEA